MSPDIDLEVGQVPQATPRDQVGRSETHEMATLQPHNSTVASVPSPVLTGQDFDHKEQPVVSQADSEAHGSSIDHPQHNVNDATSDQPTRAGRGSPSQAKEQTPAANNPTTESAPCDITSDADPQQTPEEPRMIGDFDGSASEFWKLFKDEAKSHDDARIYALKEDMESALIFAGLFSAALTGFVIDSKQDLQVKPADETVYYLRQQSTILSQISVQLASIAPQVSIPSTPPAPFPAFSPSAFSIRVNAFWFMALAFSLIAALLAILVQKWVRDYMHVFNRYSDPLKSARFRQYLYEGCEGWHMPRVADAVPGCLHASLFLFFVGLGDSLLNINTTVGISTIVPIGICGLLYILTTFLPIISPQSPYQNSFSGIFWFLFQKLRIWKYRDQGHDRELKAVDTNMARGRMQLAMEETEARKDRDVEAIRWLIDNLTEDAEMERFMSAIPGSFNTDWGREVWNKVSKGKQDEGDDRSQDEPAQAAEPPVDTIVSTAQVMPPVDRDSYIRRIHSVFRSITHLAKELTPHHSPTSAPTYPPVPCPPDAHPDSATAHIQRDVVLELSKRVSRSLVICKNRGHFGEELWRKRTRACVETTALLVCCANADFAWFGDIMEPLGDIGSSEKTRESSLAGNDQLFVTHWTCLSLVAIRPNLENNQWARDCAIDAVDWFARLDDTGNGEALACARKIDGHIQKASKCLFRLYHALHKAEDLTEEVKEILRGYESEISELERLNIEADRLEEVDCCIFNTQIAIARHSHGITSHIPGVLDNLDDGPVTFSQVVKPFRGFDKRQFIHPRGTLKSMCSPVLTLRNILKGQGNADAYKELLQNLRVFCRSFNSEGNEIQRQAWRLQDLRDGGGLGFTIELFFLSFEQLLSTSSSEESHSALYMGTFRAITSNWRKHKNSLATQRRLLDIPWRHRWGFVYGFYPTYIVEEFFSLLGNIFEGQMDSRINEARQQVESVQAYGADTEFRDRMLRVITEAQARSL